MNHDNDQRHARRILAVCKVLDLERNFLGFTLDLNYTGIKIIVNKEFPQQPEFKIILNQPSDTRHFKSDILITVEQAWRCSSNDDFDQIGGKIRAVDSPEELKNFISYCDEIEKDKYNPDSTNGAD